MLIDTHTHIYLPEFDDDRSEIIGRADQAGVGLMVLPAIDEKSLAAMESLRDEYPGRFKLALGLHPTELAGDPLAQLDEISRTLRERPDDFVAVGEIGIDLYWDKSRRDEQLDVFRRQCELAVELDKPVIIHCREALDDVIGALSQLPEKPAGVFHSFSGASADVDRIRDLGDYYFGINGVVTFKNCSLREVLPHIGLDRIVVETDAPYLAPVPKRGKRNEPAFVGFTARHIADSLGLDADVLAEATSANARRLFKLSS